MAAGYDEQNPSVLMEAIAAGLTFSVACHFELRTHRSFVYSNLGKAAFLIVTTMLWLGNGHDYIQDGIAVSRFMIFIAVMFLFYSLGRFERSGDAVQK